MEENPMASFPVDLWATMTRFVGAEGRYIAGVAKVAGYAKPKSERTAFDAFHKFITDPQPPFISKWRSDEKENWRCYVRLVDGVLTHTYSAYLAVNYHYDHLLEIERSLLDVFSDYDFSSIPRGASIAMGATPKWDFEYQSFVLSYRRCLDYFTYGMNAYFKDSADSFRDWKKQLKKHKPECVAKALLEVYERHQEQFNFVMYAAGSGKSVRDKITHNEAVSAGVININQGGIFIVGGGEKLGFGGSDVGIKLSDVLRDRVGNLRTYLNDSLTAWISAVDPNELR